MFANISHQEDTNKNNNEISHITETGTHHKKRKNSSGRDVGERVYHSLLVGM